MAAAADEVPLYSPGMSSVDPHAPSADPVGGRFEFETMLAELSSRFVNLAPADVDHEIEDALRRVSESIGIDFAVLWQWSATKPPVITPTHSYDVNKAYRPTDPLQQEDYPWVAQQMLAGRTVAISTPDDLPAEADIDRTSARRTGIVSNLTLPLAIGGEPPVGALAFNTLVRECEWPDTLVARLQLVAQVLTNAIARKRADQALRESDERLSLAADAADAGLWTFDAASGLFWATARARALFGYSPDEVISLARLQSSVHPDDREAVLTAIERSVQAGDPVNVEYRIVLPDGSVRWIASRGRRQVAPTRGAAHLMGVSTDVTERRRAEEALRVSETRLSTGADLAGLAFYEVDLGNRTAHVDDRFRDICGVPADCEPAFGVLDFWMEHLHPDDRPRVLDQREAMHGGRIERLSIEYRFMHPTDGERWIHHAAGVATRDPAGHATRTFGVLRDVTAVKRVEGELRSLSQRLIRAQEEERALLARELHDDVTQRLAVLAIDAGRAELAARGGAYADVMRTIREGIVRLSEDIHALAYQLHPSVLEELGLAEALRAECERQGRRSGLDISTDVAAPMSVVSRDAALCLYRVAQEALNNVARHAQARSARVVLRQVDAGLLLAIRDDGVGFDPAGPGRGRSLGLASMRERLQFVHGTLDIESVPGSGTAVIAWVPGAGASP